ncbi:MAG: hypothetical protein AAFY69_13055 [Pseudomonadota bacterium]
MSEGLARSAARRAAVCTALSFALSLSGCGSGGGSPTVAAPESPPPVATPPPVDDAAYTVRSTRTLSADGFDAGVETYDLIRNFGGPNPIEAPDLYAINHPGVPHIYEDQDAQVGNHFVFVLHRDLDRDRDRLDITDRQRNEIKTYNSSEDAVKGFENETLVFRWKFKINADMSVSTRFTHLFQLKAVGGDDSQPIITISGAERGGEDGIEVRHSPLQATELLARTAWSDVTGEWLDAYCRATFSDTGSFRLIVTRSRDAAVIFDISVDQLDLWRGDSAEHFVRPKWGIYRSLVDLDNLRPDEERVRFADFVVSKVELDN